MQVFLSGRGNGECTSFLVGSASKRCPTPLRSSKLSSDVFELDVLQFPFEGTAVRFVPLFPNAWCSFPFEGKIVACEAGSVAALTALLGDRTTAARARAAGALMTITIYNRCVDCASP